MPSGLDQCFSLRIVGTSSLSDNEFLRGKWRCTREVTPIERDEAYALGWSEVYHSLENLWKCCVSGGSRREYDGTNPW